MTPDCFKCDDTGVRKDPVLLRLDHCFCNLGKVVRTAFEFEIEKFELLRSFFPDQLSALLEIEIKQMRVDFLTRLRELRDEAKKEQTKTEALSLA